MTILEFRRYFKEELSSIYEESESGLLFDIFAGEIIGFEPRFLRRFMNQELLLADEEELQNILELLKTGKPYQQILGRTEFYGMEFLVNENVLIPRPETEELLELTIAKLQTSDFKLQALKILDIGTGSGIIPIVLKKHFPLAEISAIDFSEKALKVARENAEKHEVEIQFIHKDYLNETLDEVYDVIISNPPYIGKDEETEIVASVKGFEPTMALFSPNENPLVFYEKIAEDSYKYLAENGFLFLEINQKLGKETLALYHHFSEARLLQDISGNDRFIFGVK